MISHTNLTDYSFIKNFWKYAISNQVINYLFKSINYSILLDQNLTVKKLKA